MKRIALRAVTAAALLTTWALGAVAQAWPPTPTVIAHRGASALRPEHTPTSSSPTWSSPRTACWWPGTRTRSPS